MIKIGIYGKVLIFWDELKKDYILEKVVLISFFARFYIKTKTMKEFVNTIYKSGFDSFSFSKIKNYYWRISSNNMGDLKS